MYHTTSSSLNLILYFALSCNYRIRREKELKTIEVWLFMTWSGECETNFLFKWWALILRTFIIVPFLLQKNKSENVYKSTPCSRIAR